MVNDVFNLEFDADSFVANINKAIEAVRKLETYSMGTKDAMQSISSKGGNVSFSKFASDANKLNSALKQVDISTLKLDQDQLKLAQSVKRTDSAINDYSRSANKAKSATDELGKSANGTQSQFSKFGSSIKEMGGQLLGALGITAGIAGIVSLGKSVLNTTAEFEKYSAVLTNTLGSTALAENALATIKDFASKTPFSVAELTDSFVKLANQGFVPTVNEMRKLGDLASSTGKSFNQLAEAILDAQTGEFERLKEFGVKAKQTNDSVIFTFKGVQTTVAKSSEAIREYVTSLGDLKGVQGSMDAISKTLTGQISNLGDSWDAMLVSIGNNTKGVFTTAIELIKSAVDYVTTFQNNINEIQKYDPKALGFTETSSKLGKMILDFKDQTRKFTEEALKSVKTESDLQDLVIKIRDRGNAEIQRVRELQKKTPFIDYTGVIKGAKASSEFAIKFARDTVAKQKDDAEKARNAKKVANQKDVNDAVNQGKQLIKELKTVNDKIRDVKYKDKESIAMIEEKAKLELDANLKAIDENYKLRTKAEKDALKKAYTDLSKVQTEEEVKSFKEAKLKAQTEIKRAIQDQQDANRIAILDGLDRTYEGEIERLQINEKNAMRKAKELRDDRIKSAKGQENEFELVAIYEKQFQEQMMAISANTFKASEKLLSEFNQNRIAQVSDTNQLILQEQQTALAEEIGMLASSYAQGTMTKEQYEAGLYEIQKKYAGQRLKLAQELAQKEIEAIDKALVTEKDSKVVNDLQKRKSQIKEQLSGMKKDFSESFKGKKFEGLDSMILGALGIDENDPTAGKAVQAVKTAFGAITDVINQSFENEQRNYDKSIALQEKKIESAKRLADQGNAEYLQQEEEKLAELERQREESARKQMAINSAIQASQLLVAITGAITAISVPGVGPAIVAANIATIIGALATGYGLVSNLNANTPRFADGTDFVSRGNNPQGVDTIPAYLNEGEAVIQTDKNKAYSPTIKAIRRGLITPTELNDFVNTRLNGQALNNAVNNHVETKQYEFKEMNDKLSRLEKAMIRNVEATSALGLNVNLDSDGFSASLQKHQARRHKILNA